MKLLKVTSVYPLYWQKFYAQRSQLATEPYVKQKKALDYDGFGWANFWEQALLPLGYEVMEIRANIKPLQHQWAIETGTKISPNHWLLEIVAHQAQHFQPTVLFLEDCLTFPSSWLQELRQACSSIQLVVSWCGAPYPETEIFKAHDLVLSCIPELVHKFRQLGHSSEHLHHAFEPNLLERLSPTEPTIAFSFVGQIVRENQYHLQREQLLERLAGQVPLQIFTPSANLTWQDESKLSVKRAVSSGFRFLNKMGIATSQLAKLPKIGKLTNASTLPMHLVNPVLKPYFKSAVFGLEMFQTLKQSQTTFNAHIDLSAQSASNMRLFEATGAGTCLVTDWKPNLKQLFDLDREVVAYKSAEECVEKVQWLLNHPEERLAIAQAGQSRTLKDHIFTLRAIQFDSFIQAALRRR